MTRYLFVDGNYLRHDFIRTLDDFGVPDVGEAKNLWAPPVLARIKTELRCLKAFYYDSYDPDDENKRRFIEWVRDLEGFHAPVGTLKPKSKGKPARQKEVDVQLAVDVLTHVFRGNTKEVVLVAGDLDFNPLVTAVVEAGAWITLLYDARSGDRQLRMSADLAMRISLQVYMRWAQVPMENADIRKTLRMNEDEIKDRLVVTRWTNGLPKAIIGKRRDGIFRLWIDVPRHESDGTFQLDRVNTFDSDSRESLQSFAALELGHELDWKAP